jgi:2,4-dienoyl-CoA reductase-like NADH-dependent reductase (Old Yellow Enzyme family)/thioredoxin reductase
VSTFKYLFSPIKVGSMQVPNRVFMSPHGLGSGAPIGSDAHVGYFEVRARAGVGMLGIASCNVVPVPHLYPGMFYHLYDKEDLPAIGRICAAVHKHGAKVFVQGTWMTGAPGLPQPSGSAPQTLWGDNQAHSMTVGEIQHLVELHGVAAAHSMEAGADGIEFPMGGGAGLQCISSPLYNKRTDEYGGSMERRLKAIFEIIDVVRARCGPAFGLGLAVNADESLLGGPDLNEGVQICKMLADTGKIDWLRITARGQKPQATYLHYPPSYMSQGTNLYASAAVREVVDNIPIVSGGHITSPEFAEQALAEGSCDMIMVARALIADPEWASKAKRGEPDEIRACIGDVEGCFLRFISFMPVGCTVNQELGHEHEAPPPPAAKKKKVVIAGGGVAGMEAALVASQRGHDVTLLEKDDQLGGHVRLEAQLPGLGDRSDLIRWMYLQLQKQKVDIRLNAEATPESLAALHPDAVVIATGATYSREGITPNQLFSIPGADAHYVLTPEDVVLRKKPVGERVVIYDTTGYEVGPGLAEMLADQGKDVTVVSIDSKMGRAVSSLGIDVVMGMRVLPKANFISDVAITSIEDHCVNLLHQMTFQPSSIEDVDTVILVTSKPPAEGLYHSLVGKIPELHLIGDARESYANVWGIDNAMKDGKRVGMAL